MNTGLLTGAAEFSEAAYWHGATEATEAKPETVLEEAARLVDRGSRQHDYGDVAKSFDLIARGWSRVLGIDVTPMQVALCMIETKVSRAITGGFHRDSFVDIAGYARCAEKLQETS